MYSCSEYACNLTSIRQMDISGPTAYSVEGSVPTTFLIQYTCTCTQTAVGLLQSPDVIRRLVHIQGSDCIDSH